MTAPIVRDGKVGALLAVHVQPNSSQTHCAGRHGNALKIRVAAPPADGAANGALLKFLAGELSVARASLSIESGASGRQKVVLVKGMHAQQIEVYLARNGW